MYRNILKKDLKRNKTMNIILFIFIILAAMFIASSANNMLTVTTALDGYFQKAEIPDYWLAVSGEEENEKFNSFAEENGYDYKVLELIQINPANVTINGEKFDYTNSTLLSTLKNSTKVFSSGDKELTQVSDGEIYGNTAQRPPNGFVAHLLAYFPLSCTEIS